ncbi:MAG: tetratricopeptide repeat protein [Phycisphaerae bacterium]|nr:tetratricopeptide repeat protein [Phycisphaerae bacterium]
MKLLVGFAAVCVLMVAVLVWHLASGPGGSTSIESSHDGIAGHENSCPPPNLTGATESSPGRHPRDEARVPQHSLAGATETDAAPTSQPSTQASPDTGVITASETSSTQPAVRWPADPASEDALRRLSRARAALRDDPDHETALRDELAALVELGRWRETLPPLTRLRELRPDDIDLLFEQAAILLRLRRSVEAVGILNTVVAEQPEHARAWFNLAVAHQALGHLGDARYAWDRTIALEPSPAAYAQRGVVLLDLHDWAAAVADFEAVLQAEPHTADATVNLALALWKLGRTDEARARLVTLLERRPRYVPALNRLAEIAWETWRTAPAGSETPRLEAVTWCRRSLEIDPNQPLVRTWLEAALEAEPDEH